MTTIASKCAALALSVSLVFATGNPALAATYSDGGTHTISGADTNDSVSNGTTVNVVPGATITGLSIDPFGSIAISVSGSTSNLNVSGGSISGGSGSHAGGSGLLGQDGNYNLSGGAFLGGASSGSSLGELGGDGAGFSNFQSLTVSGGTYQGGAGYVAGLTNQYGYGLSISGATATAQISGGTFGNASTGGGSFFLDEANANITGGQFKTQATLEGNAVANVSGTFSDSGIWSLQNTSMLNVTGGTFNESVDLFDSSKATISGGQMRDMTLNNSSTVDVSGGKLNGEITVLDNSIFNLSGGTINTFTPTFYLGDSAVLNVYGTGLSYAFNPDVGWQLQGTLADGTPIPAFTQIEQFGSSVVNLIQTPEPSAIVLAALGLLGLAGCRWRGRA